MKTPSTKLVLRGGCGNNLITVNRAPVVPKVDRSQRQIEAIRAAREARFDQEAANEAQAIRRHRELRADKQKIAF